MDNILSAIVITLTPTLFLALLLIVSMPETFIHPVQATIFGLLTLFKR
ncbi:hypothetical protein SCREM2_gp104 [Synechococcus phage S-CREM2]|nr:hypothetical protein SCREM2_gp104 [Synechococcus phage S-CREM2]